MCAAVHSAMTHSLLSNKGPLRSAAMSRLTNKRHWLDRDFCIELGSEHDWTLLDTYWSSAKSTTTTAETVGHFRISTRCLKHTGTILASPMEDRITTRRTALVLGATGGIGGEVARHLLSRGWEVHTLHRDPDRVSASRNEPRLIWQRGDAMVAADVAAAADNASSSFMMPRGTGIAKPSGHGTYGSQK
jgi:hypothetical protein